MFINLFPKIVPFFDNMKKCYIATQAIDDNITQLIRDVNYMPDNCGKYKDALVISNTYCFLGHQWLCESASLLRCPYVVCVVVYSVETCMYTGLSCINKTQFTIYILERIMSYYISRNFLRFLNICIKFLVWC